MVLTLLLPGVKCRFHNRQGNSQRVESTSPGWGLPHRASQRGQGNQREQWVSAGVKGSASGISGRPSAGLRGYPLTPLTSQREIGLCHRLQL